jgi:hypothetical protein
MSQNTTNTTAFIEAQQYSQFILEHLYDGLLPDTFTRDVSDFGQGTTLNIKTVGDTTLQEVQEEVAMAYQAIDTGTVTLSITDYVGDAWSISDVLRQDGSQIEQLHAMRAARATKAIQEYFESRMLAVANRSQTNNSANLINGFAHRVASAETGNVASLKHFLQMKLAFDKANVDQYARIAIVDPVVEATINENFTAANAISYNPMFEGIVNEGFAREHKFVKNIFGWDVYTSNRLDKGTFGDGTTSVTGASANLFMCVSDDSTKPLMRAWRQMPKVETYRNSKLKRDEFDVTARFGIGAQRVDTLGVLITSATNY